MEFFANIKTVTIILHAFFAAVGVGATTVTDVLFFKFLKDFKISLSEKKTLDLMSRILWVALVLLILTGGMLYLSDPARLAQSSKFLVKVVMVGIIFINGIVLNLVISPRLLEIDFSDEFAVEHAHGIKRLAFACGAISISSWYLVFLLGSLSSIPMSFWQGMLLYILVLMVAVGGSQLFYHRLQHRLDGNE